MSEDTTPGLFARLLLAWVAYFRTIFDAQFAQEEVDPWLVHTDRRLSQVG